MPFLSASRIYNGLGWLPEGAVIEVSGTGEILSILPGPHPDAVFYEGILAPGFVNVHCHLELSHMKGVVLEHTSLIPFLKTIPIHRNDFTDDQKKTARREARQELIDNGVVAVGDIANTTDTLDVRALGGLHVHTFVESIGFTEANAPKSFSRSEATYNEFAAQQPADKILRQSITPHAPYSVSSALFGLISGHTADGLLSIHNQESPAEDEFYINKQGAVRDLLQTLGVDDTPFIPTGRSSLQSYLPWISPAHPMIFVHNTYSSPADIQFAQRRPGEAWWCLCPNANLYIENTLPDIDTLLRETANICIGTDSLASNHQLCILSELYTIRQHYPNIGWETLLTWGTLNGAKALQMQDAIGTIEVGKKPGIVNISGLESNVEKPKVRCVL